MVGFLIKGPENEIQDVILTALEDYEGFTGANVLGPNAAFLMFKDAESANNAQWMMQVNGAQGINMKGDPNYENENEISPE